MKKVINLLFISFISLTLASCNSKPTSSEISSSEQNVSINPVSSSTYDIDFANSLKSIKISEKQSAKELLVEQLGNHVVSYDMYNLYYDGGALKFGSSSCGGDLEIELDITITSATFKVKTYSKSYEDKWSSSEVMTIYNIDHTELVVNGIEKKLPYEEVYKKYLGPDYDFNQKDYSLIICNHIGFFEIAINMIKNKCGFIAKKVVRNYYFVGTIADLIGCLFVDREKAEERKKYLMN